MAKAKWKMNTDNHMIQQRKIAHPPHKVVNVLKVESLNITVTGKYLIRNALITTSTEPFPLAHLCTPHRKTMQQIHKNLKFLNALTYNTSATNMVVGRLSRRFTVKRTTRNHAFEQNNLIDIGDMKYDNDDNNEVQSVRILNSEDTGDKED